MSSSWAYAIVDREPAVELRGAFGEPIRTLCEQGWAILVGSIDATPVASIESLRAHDAAMRSIAAVSSSVLPIRFGTRAASDDALRASLAPRADAIRAGLEHVRDAVQVTMRVIGPPHPEDDDRSDPTEPDADAGARGGPGARYLRRRARLAAPPIPGWTEVGARLREHVRAERTQRGDPRVSERYRAYHLVARTALDAYRLEADGARARALELGLGALVFGEAAPPWAFVPEELG
jgi:hypothetical protein